MSAEDTIAANIAEKLGGRPVKKAPVAPVPVKP